MSVSESSIDDGRAAGRLQRPQEQEQEQEQEPPPPGAFQQQWAKEQEQEREVECSSSGWLILSSGAWSMPAQEIP